MGSVGVSIKNISSHIDKRFAKKLKNALFTRMSLVKQNKAIDYINQLENRPGSNTEVLNPQYRDNEIIYGIFNELDKRANANKQSQVYTDEIYVDRIISNQQWLNKNRLIKDAEQSIDNIPTIEVVKYQDEYMVRDGNHRVAVAKLNSVSKIRARIIDLDKRPTRK